MPTYGIAGTLRKTITAKAIGLEDSHETLHAADVYNRANCRERSPISQGLGDFAAQLVGLYA